MLKATEDQKHRLRKIKGISGYAQDIARNVLVIGCKEQGAYIQFGQDLVTYNLWEALLYAKNYEDDGLYENGSAQKALDAVLENI